VSLFALKSLKRGNTSLCTTGILKVAIWDFPSAVVMRLYDVSLHLRYRYRPNVWFASFFALKEFSLLAHGA
jgi:hypothetical protein